VAHWQAAPGSRAGLVQGRLRIRRSRCPASGGGSGRRPRPVAAAAVTVMGGHVFKRPARAWIGPAARRREDQVPRRRARALGFTGQDRCVRVRAPGRRVAGVVCFKFEALALSGGRGGRRMSGGAAQPPQWVRVTATDSELGSYSS
jgi:hypothetical protein